MARDESFFTQRTQPSVSMQKTASRWLPGFVLIGALIQLLTLSAQANNSPPPNILFFFADDWGRYASLYADPDSPSLNDIIQTPNIDRIGREGLLFKNAFVPVVLVAPHWPPVAIFGIAAQGLF